jgi:hypothetical protein
MNDSTEQLMKAWQPRQPSPSLRRRLFAPEAPSPVEFARAPLDWAGFTRWLVPALGCFTILMGIALDPTTRIPAGAMAPLASQHLTFAMAEGHGDCVKNTIPAKNLQWTFGAPSRSSSDSFAGADTNRLRK